MNLRVSWHVGLALGLSVLALIAVLLSIHAQTESVDDTTERGACADLAILDALTPGAAQRDRESGTHLVEDFDRIRIVRGRDTGGTDCEDLLTP